MSLKRKAMLLHQKELFENALQNRLAILSGKGIEARKADKDTLVRKWRAKIKAMNARLKLIADDAKITEEMTKIKAERAAAPLKEKEEKESGKTGKAEKPKKATEVPKEKKPKPEKKAAPPKAPEGGKSE